MSRPWFPFYVGDYVRDTARLTTEAHGAYLLLMLDYWVNGAPPDDDDVLATITKLPVSIWRKRRPTLVKFFKVTGGVWIHTRIEKEKDKAETVGTANSDKAREAAERRWAMEREKKLREQSEQCSGDAPSIDGALLQNAQSQPPSQPPSESRDLVFEEFWKEYPRRDSDEQIERSKETFVALVKAGADPKVIIFIAKAYCAKVRKQNNYATRYVKVAWRWLADQDFSGVASISTDPAIEHEPAAKDWRAAVSRWLVNESTWPRWGGNTPGSASCRCPPEIQAELGVCPNTGMRMDSSWWYAEEDTPELRANLSFAADHRLKVRLYDFTKEGVTKQGGAFFMKRIPPGYDEATGERIAPSQSEDAA